MSFFPRSFVSHDAASSSFHPLFRLLDDFDQYTRGDTIRHPYRSTSAMKSFNPRFDVKEVEDAYELHGELPGVDQKDVEIEFTDAQTITIKGRTEHSSTSGTPPSGAIEGAAPAAAIDEAPANDTSHQPTVEDESEDKAAATPAESEPAPAPAAAATSNAVAQTSSSAPAAKYWVSERSVGEFHRSFTFPVRVDQEQVRASMRNGILSVVVPKAKKPEARKITIN